MGLKDAREKAWEQLRSAPFDSEHYQAAYEYLDDYYVVRNFDLVQARRLWELDEQRWKDWYVGLAGGDPLGSGGTPLL